MCPNGYQYYNTRGVTVSDNPRASLTAGWVASPADP